jgi:molybdopterin synthase sulfur carrier subunit
MDGDTLGQIIEAMDSSYPGFKDRLVDEDGEIRYFVNIYLNGEDVRFLQGMETTTKTGDEVSIVPAVAGGAT